MLVSIFVTIALLSIGYCCNGKLEPSRSRTSKKIYEKTIITQTVEMVLRRIE